jgi:hypothetical protein
LQARLGTVGGMKTRPLAMSRGSARIADQLTLSAKAA